MVRFFSGGIFLISNVDGCVVFIKIDLYFISVFYLFCLVIDRLEVKDEKLVKEEKWKLSLYGNLEVLLEF